MKLAAYSDPFYSSSVLNSASHTPRMAKLLLAVMAVCLASVIADLEPGQHMLMQDMCTSLPDLSVLGE